MYTKRLSADKQKNQRASWAQCVVVYPQMIASTDTLDAARSQVVYRDTKTKYAGIHVFH